MSSVSAFFWYCAVPLICWGFQSFVGLTDPTLRERERRSARHARPPISAVVHAPHKFWKTAEGAKGGRKSSLFIARQIPIIITQFFLAPSQFTTNRSIFFHRSRNIFVQGGIPTIPKSWLWRVIEGGWKMCYFCEMSPHSASRKIIQFAASTNSIF